jgi:pyruvate/2-oxoglutarate dehydrogenase complex dihydrolipoamide dehydrogenase (E3) component
VGNLDLEKAGVAYDRNGVKVDRYLRTTVSSIYAAGDIVRPYLFSHIAEHEAIVATVNACMVRPIRRISYDHVIWTTFTEPELAHAGLTEEQAREQYGDSIQVYRWQYSDTDRARTDVTETGLGKFICDRKGRLVGAHILGHGATEVLHEAQLAKTLGTPFRRIARVIHAYPSYSDVVRQPAKRCYANTLRSRLLVRLLQRLHYGRGFSR